MIGDAIRKKRAAMGISQEAFADRIDMHRTYYSAVERGEKNLTIRLLIRIADGLGCKLADVFAEAKV